MRPVLEPYASGVKPLQSIRKYGQYHRPIARPILFWLNGDSFRIWAKSRGGRPTRFRTLQR